MFKNIIFIIVLATGAMVGLNSFGGILIHDDFSGGATDLHGTTPDVTIGAATWIAHSTYKADGSFGPLDAASMSLAFVPEDGEIYTLDIQIENIGGGQWVQFGFSNSQATNLWPFNLPAWCLLRQNDLKGTPYISGTSYPGWDLGLTYATASLDFRIVLDTTAGSSNWTAACYAKESSVSDYTNVLSATTLTDEAITSIGFSTFNSGNNFGQLNSISLTTPPPKGTVISLY